MVSPHPNREVGNVRDDLGDRLPAVWACLTRARSRSRLGLILRGAVWSLIFGLSVLCVLEATTIFLARWPGLERISAISASPLRHHVVLSALAGIGAFAIAVLLAIVRAPDLAALARTADRHFVLRERLSTALEVVASERGDWESNP